MVLRGTSFDNSESKLTPFVLASINAKKFGFALSTPIVNAPILISPLMPSINFFTFLSSIQFLRGSGFLRNSL